MTPDEVHALVIRSWRSEHKREPTKDEIIGVMSSWLSKWIKKPADGPVTYTPKPLPPSTSPTDTA